ncbi:MULTISPECIES: MaoC/PaaZ C-terminal domain-containing protein [Cupriavidus]|uniref:Acyl dehydratase n=2 Tax=Cupriavidus TaxID=106589 RepID=A0A7W4VE50_9BURK|nr:MULTISPECIES: MaoC/PaaZ C-terminal domain-containing protein [Cupriavidus]MBB3009904.1 acyl dehydratase [Cupriavidus alkaliphilus]QBY56221.1 acyl dehydratase [Cupriavidus oxalaticus]
MSLHFDDVAVGTQWQTPSINVCEEEIMRFAREWDPQPFHLDKEAAKASVFGELCASGLQTLLLSYRLFQQLKLFEGTTLAGLGMDHLRFHAPVLAGDTIYVRVVVEEAVVTSKPGRGLLKLRLSTYRMDELLADLQILLLVKLSDKDL